MVSLNTRGNRSSQHTVHEELLATEVHDCKPSSIWHGDFQGQNNTDNSISSQHLDTRAPQIDFRGTDNPLFIAEFTMTVGVMSKQCSWIDQIRCEGQIQKEILQNGH